MQIIWNPTDTQGGTVSHIGWNNPDMQAAIRLAFHEKDFERITRVEVTCEGMKAFFERKPESSETR